MAYNSWHLADGWCLLLWPGWLRRIIGLLNGILVAYFGPAAVYSQSARQRR
jgi:hypothetical protein